MEKREKSNLEKIRTQSLYGSRKNLHAPDKESYLYRKLEDKYKKRQKALSVVAKRKYQKLREYFDHDEIKKHNRSL